MGQYAQTRTRNHYEHARLNQGRLLQRFATNRRLSSAAASTRSTISSRSLLARGARPSRRPKSGVPRDETKRPPPDRRLCEARFAPPALEEAQVAARTAFVSAAPDTVTLKTSRDRQNWWQSVWIRRLLLLVPVIIVAFGLADAFGQRPSVATTAAPEARLTITAPTHARSGLIYAAPDPPGLE